MEITRRRLASTISFLARRALASPMDICRLISLISAMVNWVLISMLARRRCERITSGLSLANTDECLRLARMCLSIHSGLVSFFGKLAMKSLRGMPASRTHKAMTWRSWVRTRTTASRSCRTMASRILGDSFSSMNSAVMGLTAFLVAVPWTPF